MEKTADQVLNRVKTALLFPGQGAQFVGMGSDLYQANPNARRVMDQVNEICGGHLLHIMFNGPAEILTETKYCQPAILAHSLGAFEALKCSDGFQDADIVCAAGLSLGEYTALAASGALDLEDAVRLVLKRGMYMDEAARMTQGAMVAVIGLDVDEVERIARRAQAEVANYNAPTQTVITGRKEAVEAAAVSAREAGARNVVVLQVAGAFHSSLMEPAQEKFKKELKKVVFKTPKFPVVSNVDGRPHDDPNEFAALLASQITSPVQWVESVKWMDQQGGVRRFMEVGPGRVLRGLVKKIIPEGNVKNYQ